MFQYRYDPMLSVQFKHPYYQDGISADFDLVPATHTVELLRQYNLKLTQTKGGLKILCQKEFSDSASLVPVSPIDQDLDLFFAIKVNSDILNLTDLAGLPKHYWLSNQNADGTPKENLAKGAIVGVADELQLPIVPQSFQLSFSPGLYRQVQVSKPKENPFRLIDIEAQREALNLTLPQPGFYKLSKVKADASKDEQEYLCDDTLSQMSAYWGILHLRLDQNIDYTPTNAKSYSVMLPHKKAPWRYFVVLPKVKQATFSEGEDFKPKFKLMYDEKGSRYPSTTFSRKPISSWDATDHALADAIKSASVAIVYLYETQIPLPLLEGMPPKVKLVVDATEKNMPLSTPKRDQYTTNLFVNL